MHFWEWWMFMVIGLIFRREQDVLRYLQAENTVLRQSLERFKGKKRLILTPEQKALLAQHAKTLGRKALLKLGPFFTPDTLLRWHRQFVAKKYEPQKRTGRKPIGEEIRKMVLQLAQENESWGYRRICGALHHIGYQVSPPTVRRILLEAGLEPAPGRKKGLPWKTFVKRQIESLAAADFFTKEVWTLSGLKRFHVFVVMHLATRRIQIAGVVEEPTGDWVTQRFRDLTDFDDGFLYGKKYLIVDRGSVFTKRSEMVLKAEGIKMVKIPPKSPNLNAHLERFNRTIKEEALDRMLIFGERHLNHVLKEFEEYYHNERPHQSLENGFINGQQPREEGKVQCRERLGGLLKYYHRAA